MTLESFVDCEREDEPRWRIISDSRCLRVKAGLRRRKNEEKRSEKEVWERRGGGEKVEERERSRRKL
ncbi:hypothetical protein ALC56_12821 [Trachymyrmex septentrionalis]|uniref:Uncharacterized protein n=1 Tax=Trachymyrmex septentrionalis TaxID=34720 RepID=A0A195EXB5_9HYME|nr:hypothetical protein ALC56_12821 [Trachymyrmex septentrionalis]